MTIDYKAAEAAVAAAEAASAAAQVAQDAAEVTFLDGVTNVKQISEGRSTFEANRLKSRYISVFGYTKWSNLCARSR